MTLPAMNAARTLSRAATTIPVRSLSPARRRRPGQAIQCAEGLGVVPPWDAVARWVADEEYLHYQPVVTRKAKPNEEVSVNYDITFCWRSALRYAGRRHDVLAHLHVEGHNSYPGSVWAEGLRYSDKQISQLAGSGYLTEYMEAYIE
jgi:hypothetical protein